MKFIPVFLYYFLATFMTVALALMLIGTAIDVFFWLFYKIPFNFSMKEFINYLKIACTTGGVCGIGGVYYYTRTMKRQ
jgi:glucan phosphoethanolaminetransferase (alkaline phosphatase superfamily)